MRGFCHRAALLLAVIVGLLPLRSLADSIPTGLEIVGDGVDTGSWTQNFRETRSTSFDSIVVVMVKGNPFEAPTMRTFDDSSWKLASQDSPTAPCIAVATGHDTESVKFDLTFASSDKDRPAFSFVIGAFCGEKAVEYACAEWTDQHQWHIEGRDISDAGEQDDWKCGNYDHSGVAAPLPATAWMGMALLGAIAAFTIRRRARNAW